MALEAYTAYLDPDFNGDDEDDSEEEPMNETDRIDYLQQFLNIIMDYMDTIQSYLLYRQVLKTYENIESEEERKRKEKVQIQDASWNEKLTLRAD